MERHGEKRRRDQDNQPPPTSLPPKVSSTFPLIYILTGVIPPSVTPVLSKPYELEVNREMGENNMDSYGHKDHIDCPSSVVPPQPQGTEVKNPVLSVLHTYAQHIYTYAFID